jgi:hypothetical protein
MTKIIGISGRKQAGKNTVANYINGQVLKSKGMINEFYIDNDGRLAVNTQDITGTSGYGILDLIRKDSVFVDYAERELWPYIKIYHFADYLKEMCVNLFNLNPTNIYGSDDQKNEITQIKWEDVPCNPNKSGYMTYREFMEHFGTKIIRRIYNDAWVDSTISKILLEGSQISIVPDVRFPNEVQKIKDSGGIVIRLTRDIFGSDTESESALDPNKFDWKNFDYVVDNKDTTIKNMCDILDKLSFIWSL